MASHTPEQVDAQRSFAAAVAPAPIPAVQETGLLLGVPSQEYHRRELHVASKSALDQIARSPAHYRSWLHEEPREPTPALAFGAAFHVALLEPAEFPKLYRTPPAFGDLRTPANKQRKLAWEMEHAGKRDLSEKDGKTIAGMLRSVMSHPTASRLIADGQSEVTLRWVDEETGLLCKSRADYYVRSKRMAVDVKTTQDASPDEFARSVYNFGYHRQDALYRDGFRNVGEPIDHYAILAIEKEPPYAVAVYVLDADAVGKGFTSVRLDMDRMAECVRSGEWPAYAPGVSELALPRWAV